MGQKTQSHRDLYVYQQAFEAAMLVFEVSRAFPKEELYSLTDQFRRSSRSVCANIAETWRKRAYEKAFLSKLSDVSAEASETQVWIEFAVRLEYISRDTGNELYRAYNDILRTIIGMMKHPESWVLSHNQTIREESPSYVISTEPAIPEDDQPF